MVDRYTKLVLSVIALCLVWICIRDIAVTPVQAQWGQDVNISAIGGRRLSSGYLPVEEQFPVPVFPPPAFDD